MAYSPQIHDHDVATVSDALADRSATESVAGFVPGPGIVRLDLKFSVARLREALDECLRRESYLGDLQDEGFAALPLTQRPGQTEWTSNDLSGRYWIRADDRYVEEPREALVPEIDCSEFNPKFSGIYFEHVHTVLSKRFPIGRMRVLAKGLCNCYSWHRDPGPRLHIPVITNQGSLFVVNRLVTHLPADGSVYFTDTSAYHTALNGGETKRAHIVAALAYEQVTS